MQVTNLSSLTNITVANYKQIALHIAILPGDMKVKQYRHPSNIIQVKRSCQRVYTIDRAVQPLRFTSPYELPGLDLELLVAQEDEDRLQGPADQEHPHGHLEMWFLL